ncbi:TlyA family rRNA (cytidine-2'-O)-methyltransferase [bacterium]|nr:TlyA family rRNA (cytidine-2'-O)-methyltransferase [bacterium]
MSPKIRLDVLLVERGLAESRERAQRLIRAGLVYTESERLDKPGRPMPSDAAIFLKGSDCPYVSRGGLKLAGALDAFGVDPAGRVALDLGASTGGFTDCLLQRGAVRVYTIDVGTNQLHEKLRRDDRVVVREQTHIDALESALFDDAPTLAVADLSFISLRRAYKPLRRVLAPGGEAILLVKPQFEVGREKVPRGGVVTNPALHEQVLEDLAAAAVEAGFQVRGRCPSPITGGDGNREFFLHLMLPA